MKLRILDILKRVLAEDGIVIRGIYERSDAKVREQEGMKRQKGFIGDPFDTKVEIQENGVRYLVNVEDGQKTGFFPGPEIQPAGSTGGSAKGKRCWTASRTPVRSR